MTLRERANRGSQGNGQIRGNVAHSRNVGRASCSEGTFHSFLAVKERERGKVYFQTCKMLLVQSYNKVELAHLLMFPI